MCLQTIFFARAVWHLSVWGRGRRTGRDLPVPLPLPSQHCFSARRGVSPLPFSSHSTLRPPPSQPLPQVVHWGRVAFKAGCALPWVTGGTGAQGPGSQLGAPVACDPQPCFVLGAATRAKGLGESGGLFVCLPRGVGCHSGGGGGAFSVSWSTRSFSNWGEGPSCLRLGQP